MLIIPTPTISSENFKLVKLCEYIMEHGHSDNYCTPRVIYEEILRCIPLFRKTGFDISDDNRLFSHMILGLGVGKSYDEILNEISELMGSSE